MTERAGSTKQLLHVVLDTNILFHYIIYKEHFYELLLEISEDGEKDLELCIDHAVGRELLTAVQNFTQGKLKNKELQDFRKKCKEIKDWFLEGRVPEDWKKRGVRNLDYSNVSDQYFNEDDFNKYETDILRVPDAKW